MARKPNDVGFPTNWLILGSLIACRPSNNQPIFILFVPAERWHHGARSHHRTERTDRGHALQEVVEGERTNWAWLAWEKTKNMKVSFKARRNLLEEKVSLNPAIFGFDHSLLPIRDKSSREAPEHCHPISRLPLFFLEFFAFRCQSNMKNVFLELHSEISVELEVMNGRRIIDGSGVKRR